MADKENQHTKYQSQVFFWNLLSIYHQQINLDYSDEKNFSEKFKLISSIVPLSIAVFANSSLKNKKFSNFLSYRSYVWQNTSRGGLPEIFLENIVEYKSRTKKVKESLNFSDYQSYKKFHFLI